MFGAVNGSQEGGRKLEVAVDVEERKTVESGWTLAFEGEAVGGFGGVSQLTSSMCSSRVLIRAIPKLGSVEQLCRTVKKMSRMSGWPPHPILGLTILNPAILPEKELRMDFPKARLKNQIFHT